MKSSQKQFYTFLETGYQYEAQINSRIGINLNSLLELIDCRLLVGNACSSAQAGINTFIVDIAKMPGERNNKREKVPAERGEKKPPILNPSEEDIRKKMRAVKTGTREDKMKARMDLMTGKKIDQIDKEYGIIENTTALVNYFQRLSPKVKLELLRRKTMSSVKGLDPTHEKYIIAELLADDLPPELTGALAGLTVKGANYIWNKIASSDIGRRFTSWVRDADLNDDTVGYFGNKFS